MTLDLARLAAQGRAFSTSRPWTPEELEAVLLLERERGLARTTAADHVRNGILTLEDFDQAKAAGFEPKKLEEAHADAEKALKEEGAKAVKDKPSKPAKAVKDKPKNE